VLIASSKNEKKISFVFFVKLFDKNDKKIHILKIRNPAKIHARFRLPRKEQRKMRNSRAHAPASDIHVLCDKKIWQFAKEIEKNKSKK